MASGDITDYVGRTVDIVAFDGLELGREALLEQTLAQPGKGGKVVTGVQKLVQRFLLELFKEKGSDPYSERGTEFMLEARSGYMNSVTDVHGAFARAILLASNNLTEEESNSDPADERLHSVEVVQVQLVQGSARAWLKLLSQAKEDREAIFPVEFPI
jgi:hypothetical protein